MSTKGFFKPRHPERYKGDPKNIVYRSGWELRMMTWLDGHPSVSQWASEELIVWYADPVSGNPRRYFPDFLAEIDNKVYMLEVKPFNQTQPSKAKTKRRFLKESMVFARNHAKFTAAERYCAKRGWEFKVLTERELFGHNV